MAVFGSDNVADYRSGRGVSVVLAKTREGETSMNVVPGMVDGAHSGEPEPERRIIAISSCLLRPRKAICESSGGTRSSTVHES